MLLKDVGRLAKTPDAEVSIDATLVQRLLHNQHPDLAHLDIALVDAGWDNAMFRLGDRLSVRLPRRQIAAALIKHEQTWLPRIAAQLPIAVPVPYRVGIPALGYPWRWSILPWLSGSPADLEPPHPRQANRFGKFLQALHAPAPADAPKNPFRGVPLKERAAAIAERLARLEIKTNLITPTLKTLWHSALNYLSEATQRRALGWAIFFGVVMLDTGLADHPRHAAIGEQILRRVAAVGDSGN